MSFSERFARLPTAAKLLLILSAFLLPIGVGLAFIGSGGIRAANAALDAHEEDQARAASKALESLIARNALALRIAANGALADAPGGACERARQSLAVAPAVAQSFEIEDQSGKPICTSGSVSDTHDLALVGPGSIEVRIAPTLDAVTIRDGVEHGMATLSLPVRELSGAAIQSGGSVRSLVLQDDHRELHVIEPPQFSNPRLATSKWPVGNNGLVARVGIKHAHIGALDRLMMLLPVVMWVAAALITWLLVSRLLIRPLRRLEAAVVEYQPGSGVVELPRKLGPSTEIQELRDAFARVISRIADSDRDMANALEGQRRLVREVHHRVKNNLQVVASLLNIHGRSATGKEAQAAYAGIGRRVGALSVVHRNHFAEMEENRGISLRPLVSELAAELRAGAPESARGFGIDLDLETAYTTQDVAVAVAFLATEIIEFAMLNCPHQPVEISLRRTSELTARLTIASQVLVPEEAQEPGKVQFERIVAGLAKQLRSPLDRKLGRYSVDLPVFPEA
jgi:two-component sensor histidine kinase